MESEEAVRLIRPAVEGAGTSWADFGAGAGTFTRALAAILGPQARILAVDREARAGLSPPVVVDERPSAFGGTLYCALLRRR